MLAQNGIEDILIAYQMVGPECQPFCLATAPVSRCGVQVVVDHSEAVTALASAAMKYGLTVKVMLDLDVGMHRTGIPVSDAAVDIYAQIEGGGRFATVGLHVYDGHIHDEDVAERKASCNESLVTSRRDAG